MFPQVLISPLGGSRKLETEADDYGGDLHSVVGSKSTPARGTRRLITTPSIGCNRFHSTQSVDLPSYLICPFSFYFPIPPSIFSFTCPPLISFQCFYLRFSFNSFSSPLPPPTQFSQFITASCVFHSIHVSLDSSPILSSHILLAQSSENQKRRSVLSQHRFTFYCQGWGCQDAGLMVWGLSAGPESCCTEHAIIYREMNTKKAKESQVESKGLK